MAIKHAGSVKRLGPRYGRKIRHKLSEIESEQKKKHKCPYCNAEAVKRQAAGIWECRKCESKFTSRAYTVTQPKRKEEEKIEEPVVIEEDEDLEEEND